MVINDSAAAWAGSLARPGLEPMRAWSTPEAGQPSADILAREEASSTAVGDRLVRWATSASVVMLALIAASVSYRHMHELALIHGESPWSAVLVPLSVDGMIVASSMSILLASRSGSRGGWLPWTLLAIGSLASLAANVAVAELWTVSDLPNTGGLSVR
jgi:hypothetical protein